MFVAKFTQTSGAPFTADKNGNYPFIGTVQAGHSRGSVINGTMFKREKLEENQLYLCSNSVDPKYPDNVQTNIIGKVGILEFIQLESSLGAPSTKEAVRAEPQGEIANSI